MDDGENLPFPKACAHFPANGEQGGINAVVEALCSPDSGAPNSVFRGAGWSLPPSREAIEEIIEGLRAVLFPGYFGSADLTRESLPYHVGGTLDRVRRGLQEQIRRGLCFFCDGESQEKCSSCVSGSAEVTSIFLSRLPSIQTRLADDAIAAFEGDPAAASADETVFCYPGMLAITSHRLAHELHSLGVPLIPRIIAEHAHSLTGIDIHPGAVIGSRIFIDHGTGVVIGESAVIGDRVRIYQGVTLGAKSFPLDEQGKSIKGVPRHPIVEDDVVIYAGATILGRIRIGRGSIIGGNVWLTNGVGPGSRVTQAQSRSELFIDGGGI
ncbi:MAG: serine acetyltransferase [Acidobacteria bacterium]|nr:MAG: serine acetyltransferase [Acidobacteriota bacterium]